ncbi:MAG: hypothetical protein IPK17_39130 [Chloroflexi bacterium]|uniref:hypothetical protein n=1 Tax=Candidatus Flexifilum breve TaxID=3140694 RepID=UPI0031352DC1|nr:hypothetical protein [Chloroflexota bacterium]
MIFANIFCDWSSALDQTAASDCHQPASRLTVSKSRTLSFQPGGIQRGGLSTVYCGGRSTSASAKIASSGAR